MNTVDTLFTNIYAVALVLGVLYHTFVVVLAVRNRPGQWTNLAQLTIQFSKISGKAALITCALCMVQALFCSWIGLPKLATVCVIAGISVMLFQISFYFTNRKLQTMSLVSAY
jgi:hypothetical protein